MSRFVLLEAERHGALRLDPAPSAPRLALAPLGRSEIPAAVADYPLFLVKNGETGALEVAALLALVDDHNLFMRGGHWNATYVPEIVLSAPFRLSAASLTGLAIDREHPRLGAAGRPLFEAGGKASAALRHERERLERLVEDIGAARSSAADLTALGLVCEVGLSLCFEDGTESEIEGLYAVDPDALAALPDAEIVRLYRSGDVAVASLISASLAQLERLRQLHNMVGPRKLASVNAVQRTGS